MWKWRINISTTFCSRIVEDLRKIASPCHYRNTDNFLQILGNDLIFQNSFEISKGIGKKNDILFLFLPVGKASVINAAVIAKKGNKPFWPEIWIFFLIDDT